MDDPAEHVAEVAVGPEDVLRLVGRTAEQVDARRRPPLDPGLVPEQALVRVVRGDDVGEDRDEDEEAEDQQPEHGGALAQDVAQRVAPDPARRRGDLGRLGGRGTDRCTRDGGQGIGRRSGADHRARTRGSRKPYDTSTTRLTRT